VIFMASASIVCILLALSTVLQSGLNKEMTRAWGLAEVSLFNNIVVLFISFSFCYLVRLMPQWFPAIFQSRFDLSQFSWWFVIAGFCGFFIVTFYPFAFSRLGALKVFIIVVGAQMVFGILWDYFVYKIPL